MAEVLPIMVLLLSPAFIAFGISFLALAPAKSKDHPYCWRCGYDLSGLPRGLHRCTECGGRLNSLTVVMPGSDRRRYVLLWLGATLLIMPAAAIVFFWLAS